MVFQKIISWPGAVTSQSLVNTSRLSGNQQRLQSMSFRNTSYTFGESGYQFPHVSNLYAKLRYPSPASRKIFIIQTRKWDPSSSIERSARKQISLNYSIKAMEKRIPYIFTLHKAKNVMACVYLLQPNFH